MEDKYWSTWNTNTRKCETNTVGPVQMQEMQFRVVWSKPVFAFVTSAYIQPTVSVPPLPTSHWMGLPTTLYIYIYLRTLYIWHRTLHIFVQPTRSSYNSLYHPCQHLRTSHSISSYHPLPTTHNIYSNNHHLHLYMTNWTESKHFMHIKNWSNFCISWFQFTNTFTEITKFLEELQLGSK